MKSNICLLLVLITLLSFIIIPGCGGGSNSINPASSITTPTPAGAFGYITINIAWPQRSKGENKCLITLKNGEKNLTASMPADTDTVIVKIRDINDKDDPNALLDSNKSTRIFYWDPGLPSAYDTLGPFPTIKVIVRAEAYNTSIDENLPISVVEQELQIKPGNEADNTVDLALGDYIIGLTPTAPNAGDTSCDAVINTILSINYPTSVGTPTPTPLPNSVGNRTIKFEVNEVRYTGTKPNVTVAPTDIIFEPRQLTLDGDGNGSVKVTAKISPVTVSITASLINLDDETRILSSNTCEVDLGGYYSITLTPGQMGPNDDYNAKIDTHLSVDPPFYSLEGRKIKFTVESAAYTGTEPGVTLGPENIILKPTELVVDGAGNGTVEVDSAHIKPMKATIKAMLVGLDGQDTDITKTCEVTAKRPEPATYLTYPSENLIRGYYPNDGGVLSLNIPIERPDNIVMIDGILNDPGIIYTSSNTAFNINSVDRKGGVYKVIVKQPYNITSNGLTINPFNNILCVGNVAKLATIDIATKIVKDSFFTDPSASSDPNRCISILDLGHNSRFGYYALYLDAANQRRVMRVDYSSGGIYWRNTVSNTTRSIYCDRWAGREYVYTCDDQGIKIYKQEDFTPVQTINVSGVTQVASESLYISALCGSKVKVYSLAGDYITEYPVEAGATDMVVRYSTYIWPSGGSRNSVTVEQTLPPCPPTPAPIY